ncbi:hypothetical protein CYMTET_45914 [Cymbomonas tetramitiformis]|uniref:Uncharacterized protein n=1 Tax=Cymbomonas tetramitiformis TaxID=36881 RepID=A0AAE0EXK4_9CHLO|nr:hypothetical protein CYMTET_45914 [Cymbomonas tetramitiformis]
MSAIGEPGGGMSVAVNATPFVPGSSGGSQPAVTVNAVPFVPAGGLSAAVNAASFTPSVKPTGSLPVSAKAPSFTPGNSTAFVGGVNAAPFVPSGFSSQSSADAVSAGASGPNVNAPAFVPGSGASTPLAVPTNVDATPFIPRSSSASALGKNTATSDDFLKDQSSQQGFQLPDADDLLGLGMTAHSPAAANELLALSLEASEAEEQEQEPDAVYLYNPDEPVYPVPQTQSYRQGISAGRRPLHSQFMPPDLQLEITQRGYLELAQVSCAFPRKRLSLPAPAPADELRLPSEEALPAGTGTARPASAPSLPTLFESTRRTIQPVAACGLLTP